MISVRLLSSEFLIASIFSIIGSGIIIVTVIRFTTFAFRETIVFAL